MKHATCTLTVTASGKMITPLFVFKCKNIQLIVGMMKCFSHFIVLLLGKPNGRIVQCEFPTYDLCMSRQCMDGQEGDADVGQYDEFSCQCNPGPWG